MTTHDRDKIIAAAKIADEDFTGDTSFNLGDSIVGINAIERFYAIAFDTGRKSVDTPVALAEAYHCGEKAGRQAEREECIGIVESYRVSVGNSRSGELACEWTMENLREIRDAIRARGDMK